jgi:hypothetical protein
MLSFKEFLIEISLNRVKKTLSGGDPIGTVSPEREGQNRDTRKKGHKTMQAALGRESKKGMVSWSGPHRGRYQYDSGKGDVEKEGSYVVRPGKHRRAKKNFHRILTHIGKNAEQESVLKAKGHKGKNAAGAFHYTSGPKKGKSQALGHIKYNQPPKENEGDTKLKGRKSSFTFRK